jgi:hypothetical protein
MKELSDENQRPSSISLKQMVGVSKRFDKTNTVFGLSSYQLTWITKVWKTENFVAENQIDTNEFFWGHFVRFSTSYSWTNWKKFMLQFSQTAFQARAIQQLFKLIMHRSLDDNKSPSLLLRGTARIPDFISRTGKQACPTKSSFRSLSFSRTSSRNTAISGTVSYERSFSS